MLANAANVSASDTTGPASDGIVLMAGGLTCIATIVLNAVLTRMLDVDLLSLSVWFILPIGAMLGGVCAASGFWFAALANHIMPSGRLTKQLLAITAIAWFLSHWLEYRVITLDDGTPLSRVASFWEFFRYQATHQRLTLQSHGVGESTTGELGRLGYLRELLQLAGFMVGGTVVIGALEKREACLECRKYATHKTLLSGVKPDKLQRVLTLAQLSVPEWDEYAKAAVDVKGVAFTLTLLKCPKCTEQSGQLEVAAHQKNVKLQTYPLSAKQSALLSQAAAAGKK